MIIINDYFGAYFGVYPTIWVPEGIQLSKNEDGLKVNFYGPDDEDNILESPENNLVYSRNWDLTVANSQPTISSFMNVLDAIKEQLNNDKYLAVEINATQGTTTLCLANDSDFARVMSYTDSDRTLMMLRRNLNMYNCNTDVISSSVFSNMTINAKIKGSVVFIHQVTLVGNEHYVNASTGLTLLSFLTLNTGTASFVAVRVTNGTAPRVHGYKTMDVESYTVYINETTSFVNCEGGLANLTDKNTRQLVTARQPVAPYRGGYFKSVHSDIALELGFSMKPIIEQSRTTGRETEQTREYFTAEKSQVFEELPTRRECFEIAGVPVEGTRPGSDNWRSAFKMYIKSIIELLEPEDNVLIKESITDDRIKRYWMPSVIHMSANAAVNYESLETLGDKYLGSAFYVYCRSVYPKMTPSEYNALNTSYLSVAFQPLFAKQMKLNDWIISLAPVGPKMLEDIFESFTGALYHACDSVEEGYGFKMVNRLVTHVFTPIDLYGGEDMHIIDKKTYIKQLDDRLGVKAFDDSGSSENSTYTHIYKIRNELINFMKGNGLDASKVKKKVFVGKGATAKEAKEKSAVSAYFEIKKGGLTDEWVSAYNDNRKIEGIVNMSTRQAAMAKASKMGYSDLRIVRYVNEDSYKAASLVGIKVVNGVEHRKNLGFSMKETGNIPLNTLMVVISNDLYHNFI